MAATIVHIALGRFVMRLRNLALYGFSWYPTTVFVGTMTFVGAWMMTHRGVTDGGILWLVFGVVIAGAWVVSILFPEGALSMDDARKRLDLLAAALGSEDAERLRLAVVADGYQAVAAWLWPAVRWARQKPPPPHDRYVMWASNRLRSTPAVSC